MVVERKLLYSKYVYRCGNCVQCEFYTVRCTICSEGSCDEHKVLIGCLETLHGQEWCAVLQS